jgi:hypothetical protein
MAGYSGRLLAEKLGIKPGFRILAIHAPTAYRKLLGPLPNNVVVLRRTVANVDLIHLFVSRRADIEKELPRQRRLMADSAVLWVSWPKKASGVATEVTEDVVREVALPPGLLDTKVCAVDEVWSGLKLVIRRELRRRLESNLPVVAELQRDAEIMLAKHSNGFLQLIL